MGRGGGRRHPRGVEATADGRWGAGVGLATGNASGGIVIVVVVVVVAARGSEGNTWGMGVSS